MYFNGSLVSLQGYGKTQQSARSKEAKLVQTRVVTTGDDELGTLATDDKKTVTIRRQNTRQSPPPKSPHDYPQVW